MNSIASVVMYEYICDITSLVTKRMRKFFEHNRSLKTYYYSTRILILINFNLQNLQNSLTSCGVLDGPVQNFLSSLT